MSSNLAQTIKPLLFWQGHGILWLAALLAVEGTAPHYQIVLTREFGGLDDVEVRVELKPEDFSDKIGVLEVFQRKIHHEIHRVTGIHVKVTLVAPGTIPRSEGKAKRVIDNRVI